MDEHEEQINALVSGINSPESWEIAKRIVSLLGDVPSYVTTAIGFLKRDLEQNANEASGDSLFCFKRMLRGPGMKAPFYYLTLTLEPDIVEQHESLSSLDLVRYYKADELISLLSVLYLFRRISRGCDQEIWPEVANKIIIGSELGAHIGRAIPKIGMSFGLMLGGIRHLASAMFLGIDKKGFWKYSNYLRSKNIAFDLEREMRDWGCNHGQIAALLLQKLGVGATLSNAVVSAITSDLEIVDGMDDDTYRIKIAQIWLDSVLLYGKAPQMKVRGEYYPLKEALDHLLEHAESIRQAGSRHNWLNRTKDDITPEKTPLLFSESVDLNRTEAVEMDMPEDFS
ncbi:MAG: hypothetical protein D6719_13415 [Candidatus Dadabacteria bacterium]|nr:MAG: hypothetical protein D6719_13415 [Candidatus Dadabacteria bacterium]